MDAKFASLVAGALKIDPSRLHNDSTAQTVPEWDSLTHWAVIGMLEEAYGVEFTMDEATEFKNLGEIYETLMKKLS
ncbi:MAG: acyl carrier protein [Clostridiales bacterium]|jgi:acyl carrier protein|nr:acyl carrier protein [Eubacteriales bacterium]MDH7567673.1 acyl carrier protein [Clostridiales bacterium]